MNEELPFCECGCGLRVTKEGNRFRLGHNRCKTSWEPKFEPEPKLCGCGCGKLALPGNDYVNGHSGGVDKHSIKSCHAISEGRKGKYGGKDNPFYGKHHSSESLTKISGGSILNHHHIYDHNDLSKYTIKMTRREHSRMHRFMEALGLEIPHINTGHESEEENKLMKYIKKINEA